MNHENRCSEMIKMTIVLHYIISICTDNIIVLLYYAGYNVSDLRSLFKIYRGCRYNISA